MADEERRSITLDLKTVIMALAVAAGGAIGGGATSVATQSSAPAAVTSSLSQIQASLAETREVLVEMRGQLGRAVDAESRHDKRLDDHDSRLRALEKKVR